MDFGGGWLEVLHSWSQRASSCHTSCQSAIAAAAGLQGRRWVSQNTQAGIGHCTPFGKGSLVQGR